MWEWVYRSHTFLTSALVGGEWSASRPGRFTPGKRTHGTHWIGGWVNPRTGLDDVEDRKFLTLPGLELRPLGRPARGQSLYRLRYPGSSHHPKKLKLISCRIGSSAELLLPCGCYSPRWTLASVLQFLNHTDSRYDSLGGGSACRKAATYTGQQKE
jgi:hypothetical protein